MLSKNNFIEQKLETLVLELDREETRNYEWISEYEDINFWKFLSICYLDLDRFFTLLDVETGPESGWERFVEALGLVFWEDRKWCHQFHTGVGPTRVALSKILERNGDYDKNLSLSSVLQILKSMDRYDILLQIDWTSLSDKFRESSSSCLTSKYKEIPRLFQLNVDVNASHLVKAQSIAPQSTSSYPTFNGIKEKRKRGGKGKNSNACIMMAYAKDAEDYANKVADGLRSEQRGTKLKFLMLGDPNVKRFLAMDLSNTLHKWLLQVRYVVPVLSPQYLKQVQNIDSEDEDSELALINRQVYKFIFDQYFNFGSRNLRCRPICPDSFSTQVRNSLMVKGNGLFSVIWNCSSSQEIKEFAMVLEDPPLIDEF